MSLEALRKALVGMRPTGPDGFEGLAAALLSAVTGDVFHIARSGDQPADALTPAGHIAMQAKRYDKARIDETEFEGDFSKACRSGLTLDCYVFAVSRCTAQLSSLARDLEHLHGVDVIILQFGTLDSELPALCVTFWDVVKGFPPLSNLGPDFVRWVASQASRPEVVATVQRLRDALTKSVPLAAMVERKLKAYLDGRFGIDKSSIRPSRFRIDLPSAVVRQVPQRNLSNWWTQAKTRVAVAEGEEGMGKSWAASEFCRTMAHNSSALVFWLDSADWSGLPNLEQVLDASLMQAGFSDRHLRERLIRKAMTRWSDRLLIALDGVNERSARETANRLLVEVSAAPAHPCRLLFTTRPINWKMDERSLWKSVTTVTIDRFTDAELSQALTNLPTPIDRNELPRGLVEVAKVPRYLQRAIELREQFTSFTNVSKEMVLWADLLTKVEAGDLQLTGQIGWNSAADVKRALLKLATAARSIGDRTTTANDSYSILQNCFADRFEQVRSDLAEQRIVLEPASENPAPSPAHVILGFALHLGILALKHPADSINELADRLRKELEPVLAQDQLTEALFVALQLSAFPGANGHQLSSRARSAFLVAWISSQNSYADASRLQFWAQQDLVAYLDFVEEVFVEPVSDSWAGLIIQPLVDLWSAAAPELTALDHRLRNWLKLVWKSHDLPTSTDFVIDGHRLPIARSRSHLELSFVALTILSTRPEESFLVDLAVARATDHLSSQRHFLPKHPGAASGEGQDFGCKDLTGNLGSLLRWRYTETIHPRLESLRQLKAGDSLVVKGLERMSRAFHEFGWTRGWIPEDHLRQQLPVFPVSRDARKHRVIDCSELAMRDDLPDLCANDREVIREKVEAAFASSYLLSSRSRTEDDYELDCHLAWFAKYYPKNLAELGSKFRLVSLDRTETAIALYHTHPLPFIGSPAYSQELLAKAKATAEREIANSSERFCWALMQLHTLAITCLEANDLKDWLVFSSERRRLRRDFSFYPVPILYPLLMPESLARFAREQAKLACNEPPNPSTTDDNESLFDFWAYIGGIAGNPDAAFNAWTLEQIKTRKPEGERRYYWLLLWFRTAPQAVLESAVADGLLLGFFPEHGRWPLTASSRRIHDWSKLPKDFNTLADQLPVDDLGTLLLLADRQQDLARWGQLVFAKALELVGKPPFERSFWGTTTHAIGDSGEIWSSSCNQEEGQCVQGADGLRPTPPSNGRLFPKQMPLKERDRKANEGIRIWREDRDRLARIRLEALERFGARGALEAWCKQNPDLFIRYANELLEQAADRPSEAFHLGAFITYVIDALVRLDPELAIKMDSRLRDSSMRVNVINEYGVPTFIEAFWQAAGEGNAACREHCAGFLQACSTEEELMSHAITAQAERAHDVLLEICTRLLESPLAKDRCLAISLLAWMPGANEIGILERLMAEDPSGWVRSHAKWATECAKHEASVRRHYERILKLPDRVSVMASLQVLLPALTPTARWWHRELEQRSKVFELAAKDIQAALAFFWYESKSKYKKTPVLFGRSLGEYLRGERIHDLRSPKPRLLDSVAHYR